MDTSETPVDVYIKIYIRPFYSYSHNINGDQYKQSTKEEDDLIEQLLLDGVFITKSNN